MEVKNERITANSDDCIGEWKRHNKGKGIHINSDHYKEKWKDNKKYGKGNFIYLNGDKYEGEWKDSKRLWEKITYWKTIKYMTREYAFV